jgi:hypothetical protein
MNFRTNIGVLDLKILGKVIRVVILVGLRLGNLLQKTGTIFGNNLIIPYQNSKLLNYLINNIEISMGEL